MKVVNSWAAFLIVLVLLQQSLKEVGADSISDTCAKIDKDIRHRFNEFVKDSATGTLAQVKNLLAGADDAALKSYLTSCSTYYDTIVSNKEFEKKREEERSMSLGRRLLIGSSPPQCTSKCGKCTPCKPVLVRVPPRTPVTSETYEPEVWRCKCGNKLYIP